MHLRQQHARSRPRRWSLSPCAGGNDTVLAAADVHELRWQASPRTTSSWVTSGRLKQRIWAWVRAPPFCPQSTQPLANVSKRVSAAFSFRPAACRLNFSKLQQAVPNAGGIIHQANSETLKGLSTQGVSYALVQLKPGGASCSWVAQRMTSYSGFVTHCATCR